MTTARIDEPPRPALPAPHFGSASPFEQDAARRWGLTLLDARALLVLVKRNGKITCANLGAELWGHTKRGSGNCSCPWARPAGVVMKRLREKGLVERDRSEPDRIGYCITRTVRAVIDRPRGRRG